MGEFKQVLKTLKPENRKPKPSNQCPAKLKKASANSKPVLLSQYNSASETKLQSKSVPLIFRKI